MKSRSMPQEFPRLPFLEGLRGLAALYVMFGHIASVIDPSQLAGKPSESPPWLRAIFAGFGQGHLAVASFIVISGFCLQISLFNGGDGRVKKPWKFFARRAERILPAYWAALGISLLVTVVLAPSLPGMPFDLYRPVTTQSLLEHVFLIHNWNLGSMYKINGVLWSIALEAQLYLLLPAIVAGIYRWGRVKVVGILAMVSFATLLLPNAPKLYGWFLVLFGVGIVLAHAAYRPPLDKGANPRVGFWLTGISFVVTVVFVGLGAPMFASDCSMGVCVGGLCYALTTSPVSHAQRFFQSKRLVWVGAFSYSLYLIHHPLLQTLFAFRPSWTLVSAPMLGLYFLACVPVVILLSALFAIVFEAPFVRNRHPSEFEKLPLVPTFLPLRAGVRPKD